MTAAQPPPVGFSGRDFARGVGGPKLARTRSGILATLELQPRNHQVARPDGHGLVGIDHRRGDDRGGRAADDAGSVLLVTVDGARGVGGLCGSMRRSEPAVAGNLVRGLRCPAAHAWRGFQCDVGGSGVSIFSARCNTATVAAR